MRVSRNYGRPSPSDREGRLQCLPASLLDRKAAIFQFGAIPRHILMQLRILQHDLYIAVVRADGSVGVDNWQQRQWVQCEVMDRPFDVLRHDQLQDCDVRVLRIAADRPFQNNRSADQVAQVAGQNRKGMNCAMPCDCPFTASLSAAGKVRDGDRNEKRKQRSDRLYPARRGLVVSKSDQCPYRADRKNRAENADRKNPVIPLHGGLIA